MNPLNPEVKAMSADAIILMILIIGGYTFGAIFLLNKVFSAKQRNQ